MRPKLGLRVGLGFGARVTVVLAASCTVLTGVDELTVDDDGEPIGLPDGGGEIVGSRDGGGDPPAGDGGANEGSVGDGGADAADGNVSCDEPGLVAYWRFDEGSGIDVRDCTANALHGKLEAGTWVQGAKGTALAFDGGWVDFGNAPLFNKAGPFTVLVWARQDPHDAGGTSQYIVGKTTSAGNNGWRLATQGSQYAFSTSGDGGVQAFAGGVTIGKWTHVAAVYIPSTAVEIYVDGQLLTRNPSSKSAALVPTADELRIATKGDNTFPFTGAIDEVRLYDRALDAAEIAARAAP